MALPFLCLRQSNLCNWGIVSGNSLFQKVTSAGKRHFLSLTVTSIDHFRYINAQFQNDMIAEVFVLS
jgi:hypothetical protein